VILFAIGYDVKLLYNSIETVVEVELELVAVIVLILYNEFDDVALVIIADNVVVAAYAVVLPTQFVAFNIFGAAMLASEN